MSNLVSIFNIKTIRNRISFLIIALLFVVFALWFVDYKNTTQTILNSIAQNTAQNHANDYVAIIKNEIENTLLSAQSLTDVLSGVKNIDENPNLSRKQVNSILKNFLTSHKNLTAIGIFWEPNGFDNNDDFFKNKDIYGRTGNFAAYWYKSGQGRVDYTPYLEGYISDFYTIPKKTKRPMFIPPHSFHAKGKDVLVVTVVHPIIYNAKFYGIITIDALTKSLEQIIELSPIYNNKSKMQIIANDGTIVASTAHPDLAGAPLKELYTDHEEQIVDIIRGRQKNEFENGSLIVYMPISFEQMNTNWQFRLEIPENEAYGDGQSDNTRRFFIFVSLSVVLLLFVLGAIYKLLLPLKNVAAIAEKLGRGDVRTDIQINVTGEETAKIKNAFEALINSFRQVSTFALEIGKGNLDYKFEPLGPNDELGNSLLVMKDSLVKAKIVDDERKEEDRKRNWSTEGLAKFNEILRRQSDDIEVLSYNVMVGLINYLNANQGALFIYNDDMPDDVFLELIVAIAYDERRYMKRRVKPGDGIIGTCAIEKQTIYLSKVPENYIEITSGMGQATPRFLLIVPLVINNQIFGIVELASFKDFNKHEIEFTEKLAESIASTISVTKVNIRTNKLLELSKQQSEELAAQEEEMRQNLEELKATQEEMFKKEALMKELALEMKMQEETLIQKLDKYTTK